MTKAFSPPHQQRRRNSLGLSTALRTGGNLFISLYHNYFRVFPISNVIFIPSHLLKIQLMALTYASNSIKYKTKQRIPTYYFSMGTFYWSLTWGWEKHKLSNIQSPEEPVSSTVCHLLPKEEKQEQKV